MMAEKVTTVDYLDFLKRKSVIDPDTGLASIPALNPMLYPHQSDMVKWALRRGREAMRQECMKVCETPGIRCCGNHYEEFGVMK
jgi:hypothetical protein